jgi:hypothetical protein
MNKDLYIIARYALDIPVKLLNWIDGYFTNFDKL